MFCDLIWQDSTEPSAQQIVGAFLLTVNFQTYCQITWADN